jgi:hypothetical protein
MQLSRKDAPGLILVQDTVRWVPMLLATERVKTVKGLGKWSRCFA